MPGLTVYGNWTTLQCDELVLYSLQDKHPLHDDKILKTHTIDGGIVASVIMGLIDA